jgi:hypothetical protein
MKTTNLPSVQNLILVSSYGSGIALGLSGSPEFLESQFNLFFNCGAVSKNGTLHKESEGFGYFVTSEDRVKSALALAWQVEKIHSGDSKGWKKRPQDFEAASFAHAETVFDSYKRENFMGFNLGETYNVAAFFGGGGAVKQKPEEDFHFDKVAAQAISG